MQLGGSVFETVALSALVGLVSGGLAGFVIAIVQLQAKRLRNSILFSRGLPAIRDVVLIKLHWPGAFFGALFGGALGVLTHGDVLTVIVAATSPSILLVVVLLVVITQQALTRAGGEPGSGP